MEHSIGKEKKRKENNNLVNVVKILKIYIYIFASFVSHHP